MRQTNAAALVIDATWQTAEHGLLLRGANGELLVWDLRDGVARPAEPGVQPALFGEYEINEGRRCRTVMSLARRAIQPPTNIRQQLWRRVAA